MSTQKKIAKQADDKGFNRRQMTLIHGYLSKAAEEGDIFIGKSVSVSNNYKRFLRVLRRESHELAMLMPSDPAPRTAKYRYLYQVVFRRTRGKAPESIDESVEESFLSDEQLGQTRGGPSPSTQRTIMTPGIESSPENPQYPKLTRRDGKVLFGDPCSPESEEQPIDFQDLSAITNDSPL